MDNLTLLYTYNLRGELAMLPRLYTFMQSIRFQRGGKPLILDLGGSCQPDIWHCRVTGGRSTLIVLDGMGYHAANVGGLLNDEDHDKLKGIVRMGLVDQRRDWVYDVPPLTDDSIVVTCNPKQNTALRLQILLTPGAYTHIDEHVLYLAPVDGAEVGVVQIQLEPEPELTAFDTLTLPADTLPNPTITAAVEFVESEARYYEKHQQKDT